jgi:hypothetical protein
VVPPLPIPNRTVKRLCADDSDLTVVKVGHRQAPSPKPPARVVPGVLFFRTLGFSDQQCQAILCALARAGCVNRRLHWHVTCC